MMERYVRIFFILNLLLCTFNFWNKQVHDLYSFLFHTCLDAISLSKIVKCFKHIHSLLDRSHLLKCKVYHVLIHHVKLFHASLECIVLLVPIWCFYIQNFILFICFEFINQLNEWSLYLEQNSNNFRSSWTSKFRKLIVPSFQGKLKLPLTNLYQLWTPLNKCLDWCKYRICTKIPLSCLGSIDHICEFFIDLSPSFSTFNSII